MQITFRIIGVLLLATLVFAVAGVVATWAPDKSVAELSVRWAAAPSRFIPVNGMQVHVRDEGLRDDPQPIVLLHGTSASLHTWDGWVQSLRGRHRVIRFDLPGFGLTGPDPKGDYSIAAYVRFVAATLDSLGVRSCVLAGNSLGGQIAWSTAAQLPERVSKLVLVDSAGYPMHPRSVPIGFALALVPGIKVLTNHVLPRGVIESSLRNVYGDPAKVTSELVDRYYDLALRAGNRPALALRLEQPFSGDLEPIKSLKLPTLVLWGGRDALIPPENGERFATDIAGARLVVFNNLGHVPHEEDPEQTVQAVKEFLDR